MPARHHVDDMYNVHYMYNGDNDDGDGNGENGDNGDDNGSGADDDGDNVDYRES